MKKWILAALMLALCLMGTAATAQDALTATGLENEVVDRMWETSLFFTRMAEMTGINVTGSGVGDVKEYQAMLEDMQKGTIPADMLFKACLTREQEIALLDCGALIDLAQLMEANMPNLTALLDAHPEWRESITLDDGRIASLPAINEEERQVLLWINKAWLDELGIAMPTSVAELTDALAAMMGKDLNKNMNANDEKPADLLGVFEMRWLLPYFGIVADDWNIARMADGSLAFAPELPAYRDFIALLREWNEKGILPERAFTEVHSTQVVTSTDEEAPATSGLLLSVTPYTHVPAGYVMDYVPLLLAGPDGTIRWRDMLGEIWPGCFAVTSACKDPAAALRWADALYAEEGAMLGYAGLEGVDYEYGENGYWLYKTDSWRTINTIRAESLMYTGAMMPGITPNDFMRKVDSEADRYVLDRSAETLPYCEQVTQPFALSQADQQKAEALAHTLTELVDEGIGRFATGEAELNDENYEAWLQSLRDAGSGELLALFEGAQAAP